MMQPKTILNPPMDTDGAIPCGHMLYHGRGRKRRNKDDNYKGNKGKVAGKRLASLHAATACL
jgi:hypothetical protein